MDAKALITESFVKWAKGEFTAEQLEKAVHAANEPKHPLPWAKKTWESRNYQTPFAPKRYSPGSYQRWGVIDAAGGWVATVQDEETADLLVSLANPKSEAAAS